MRYPRILALLPVLMLCAAPTLSSAAVEISFSVNIAPPELPIVYEQPALPEPGYIWTPGYWAWDGMDYYWVPGTWVLPPDTDLLWTPGYWAWREGAYGWSPGYWAPEVGYYGGVNYGFGYTGIGFQGGYWHGGAFFYNRAVANFGQVNVVNVYNAPVRVREVSRVSFNGGPSGLRYRPSAAERVVMNERHRDPTPVQRQHQQGAAAMPTMHASQNGGHPQVLTTQRAGDFAHPGTGLHNHAQGGIGVRHDTAPPPQERQQVQERQPLPTRQQFQERQFQERQGPQERDQSHFGGAGPAVRAQEPSFRPEQRSGPPPDRGAARQQFQEAPREQAPRQEGGREQGQREQGPSPRRDQSKRDEPKRDR